MCDGISCTSFFENSRNEQNKFLLNSIGGQIKTPGVWSRVLKRTLTRPREVVCTPTRPGLLEHGGCPGAEEEAAPQHLLPVALGAGRGRAKLVPVAFGPGVAVPVQLPVAFPQEGAVGRQGESRERRRGGGGGGRASAGLGASGTEAARVPVEEGGFVLAHKLVVELQEVLVQLLRGVGDADRRQGRVEGKVAPEPVGRLQLEGAVGVLRVEHPRRFGRLVRRRGGD